MKYRIITVAREFGSGGREIDRNVSLNAANESPCVIIGRGADYILRDRDDVLSVFIHADDESRQKRIMQRHYKSEQKALEMMHDMDRRRSISHKYFTDREWGKSQYYGICLSSSQLEIDSCVSLICEAYHGGVI